MPNTSGSRLMIDILIAKDGVAGRITLNRLPALNALTYEMCNAIVVALDIWQSDPEITLVIFDAMGQKAFCAGGDIVELYSTGQLGNFAYGQSFWRDEYRLNAKIKAFPKPVISFMQGFIMGGGVGLGCHSSHRVVGDSSQIAMPECGIGLVPDVGGSLILANAPGRLGEYLGTTATRLNAGDAIMAGFADHYIPEEKWPGLIEALGEIGDCRPLFATAQEPPEGPVTRDKDHIDRCFSGNALADIIKVLRSEDTPFSQSSLKAMRRNSPLSMACEIEIVHRLRGTTDIRKALELEYRFTYRAMEHGDFLEGIRAAIIDKDRIPHWQHQIDEVPMVAMSRMLLPLGAAKLTF